VLVNVQSPVCQWAVHYSGGSSNCRTRSPTLRAPGVLQLKLQGILSLAIYLFVEVAAEVVFTVALQHSLDRASLPTPGI
jgi:hypothetical protein